MALIRGSKGYCPCPICLVPKEELSNLTTRYALRNAKDTQQLVQEAHESTAAIGEESLKSQSIRDVNVFCKIQPMPTELHVLIALLSECILGYFFFRSSSSTIMGPHAWLCAWVRWQASLAWDSANPQWSIWTSWKGQTWYAVCFFNLFILKYLNLNFPYLLIGWICFHVGVG